jgi:hypothetical protein
VISTDPEHAHPHETFSTAGLTITLAAASRTAPARH